MSVFPTQYHVRSHAGKGPSVYPVHHADISRSLTVGAYGLPRSFIFQCSDGCSRAIESPTCSRMKAFFQRLVCPYPIATFWSFSARFACHHEAVHPCDTSSAVVRCDAPSDLSNSELLRMFSSSKGVPLNWHSFGLRNH